jgi:hypothetical protein
MAAAVLVSASYIPWVPQLQMLLNLPGQSIGRLSVDHSIGVADGVAVFLRVGFSEFLLVLFLVGLGLVIVRLFRGAAAEGGILVAWLGIPVLLMWRTAGSSLVAIDVRYLAFLVPAAIVLVAVGIEGAARGFELLVQRGWRVNFKAVPIPHPALIATGLLVALMLAQAVPALAASYRTPKEDWRSAARHISASSPAGSYVLAVGGYSDWSVLSLRYFFHRLDATVNVIDGMLADSDVQATFVGATGAIWGVVTYPSTALLTQPGEEKVDFVDVTGHIHVFRAADRSLSPGEQARTLLNWSAQAQPKAPA